MIISSYDDIFIVKIFKDSTYNINDDIDSVLEIFKIVLKKLRNKYDVRGLCYIDIYTNDDYGIIIEVDNVYKYDDDIDIKVSFHFGSYFMMEIEDIDIYKTVYYYDGKYYTEYENNFDSYVIYNCDDIINDGIKIK